MAGLSAAVRIMAAGFEPVVLERQERAGGNVGTDMEGGFCMERGPHTFMASASDVFSLVQEVGAGPDLVAARKTSAVRFIARGGKLHPIFTGPLSFLTSELLSTRGKLDLVTEPFRTRKGDITDSASTFFERRFGPEAARVLAGSFVSGVYAGDPEILSAPAAFPLFWGFEEEHGGMIRGGLALMMQRSRERRAMGDAAPPRRKGLFTLRGGLGTVARAAARTLGGRLHEACPVTAVRREGDHWEVTSEDATHRAPWLVLAVPPREASRLMASVDPDLSDELAQVVLAPVAVVHMGFARAASSVPDGFGFLVPRGEGIRTLGVLFPSRMFDDRAPAGGDLFTAYVGGMLDPEALDLDDAELHRTVQADLEELTGFSRPPEMVRVRRHPHAIPQLTLGHMGRMKRIATVLKAHRGLLLAGNYLRGVGIKDAVASGFQAAGEITRRMMAS